MGDWKETGKARDCMEQIKGDWDRDSGGNAVLMSHDVGINGKGWEGLTAQVVS